MKLKSKTISVILLLLTVTTFGQVRLPKLISNGMVLQRNTEVTIWGWASNNEEILVTFLDSAYITTTNGNGEWSVVLSGLKAGGPHQMQIVGTNSITIDDVLVGDVWVCSGQSNMELTMKRASPIYEVEIANSENPYIRYFEVPDKYNFNLPQKDLLSGEWKKTNPESILTFSATSYFFAKEIYDRYKVPIGLINASLGGSPAQAWMSEDALKEFPEYYAEAQRFKDSALVKQIIESDKKRINDWYALSSKKDLGHKEPLMKWNHPDLNTSDWRTMVIPGYWADNELGSVNGVVWFRKNFTFTSSIAGKQAKLNLGRIVDADSVFINGVFVGRTTYQYPPRRYVIPKDLLMEGENLITIRVINNSGNGGFVLDKPYEIISGNNTIDLKGDWQFCLGAKMEPLKSQTFIRWKPVGLYNSMIAPLLNYRIKGVIWYQGESNAKSPTDYGELFSALISIWRENWNQGDFPFLYVQLPNFMETKNKPSESNWALIREAQLNALSVLNTGMAVAIDIGEWNDIHPLNKKDVGKRLSLVAQKVAYGDEDVVFSGPIYQSMEIDENKIILSFNSLGGGLIAKGNDELKYFSIAGDDRKFVWANAKIENDKVIVWSDKVSNPIAVRYAWADNPEGANLYNQEGLPASPFRTDEFN